MLFPNPLPILALNALSWSGLNASATGDLNPEHASHARGSLLLRMQKADCDGVVEKFPCWEEFDECFQQLLAPFKTAEPATGQSNYWLDLNSELPEYPEVTYPKLCETPDYPEVTYPKLFETPEHPEVTYPKLYEVFPGEYSFYPKVAPLNHGPFPDGTGQTRRLIIKDESRPPRSEVTGTTREDAWPTDGDFRPLSNKLTQADEPLTLAVQPFAKKPEGRRATRRKIRAGKLDQPETAQKPRVRRSSMSTPRRERDHDNFDSSPAQLKELARLKNLNSKLVRQHNKCNNDFQAGRRGEIERKLEKTRRAIERIEKAKNKS